LALCRDGALVVINKADLAVARPAIEGVAPIAVSARTGEGLPALHARLAEETAQRAEFGETAALTRPRHRAALGEAVQWLADAEAALLPEVSAEALRAALRALGRLTGHVGVDAVLDLVFADFCIGK
jgi:tRNA modification GTPase